MSSHTQEHTLHVQGMHCRGCEVLIERKFGEIDGISSVRAHQHRGTVSFRSSRDIPLDVLNAAITADGYHVTHEPLTVVRQKNTALDYMEIGAVAMILFSSYLLFSKLGLIPEVSLSENMSYGVIFIIGLVAAFSTCMAVSGGLLLAISARAAEKNPHATHRERFVPHLYFNIGRIISYTFLGGAIGALGSVIALSPAINGIVTVLASLVMIVLGFQILNLFPRLSYLIPKMPKLLGHRIHALAGRDGGRGSFLLGAGTFFLPCGFTQALQLYVLAQGSALTGALTMLTFALGTLPAFLAVGAVSQAESGTFRRYLLKTAGVLALTLGIVNTSAGFTLLGVGGTTKGTGNAVTITEEGGTQVVEMKVRGLSYSPSQFVVKKGVPVEWRIDGTGAAGCARVIVAPKLGLSTYLKADGPTIVTFTPEQEGTIEFSCSMGMTTRGAKFIVKS